MHRIIVFSIFLILAMGVFSQQPLQLMLAQRGEVIVSVDTAYLSKIPNISSWSIDYQKNGKAIVYLNAMQYKSLIDLEIPFLPEAIPSMKEEFVMASRADNMAEWDAYPNYDTYLAMMKQFTLDYPDLCILDTIGESVEGRLLITLKISDNVKLDEAEPEVFYTSSMHGDELTGYVLMLRLTDYLLVNYSKPNIKELVDNLEIYINPLANPDGTFAGGNNSVYGATRGNSNYVDLNRNFPDPKGGSHPDGNLWQLENLAMMDYMKKRNFSLSMNFHGGIELLNYPWDTYSKRHADDAWMQLVCKEYVDTVHAVEPNYMTGMQNGITNGYDWYEVEGGRQDYITYFLHGREITAELSDVKLISASQLPQMWEYNYRSLLNYLKQALYGVHGLVTDTLGNAIVAKISIANHDKDSSHVWSQSTGIFYRYLKAGSYELTIESEGYQSKTISVTVNDFQKTSVTVQLEKLVNISEGLSKSLMVFPNPATNYLNIKLNHELQSPANITVYSSDGKVALSKYINLQASESLLTIDVSQLKSGIYIVNVEQSGIQSFAKIVIKRDE